MPKHELVFDAGEYAPVADRIALFYERYPSGRILTRLISRTRREITVQAFVFRSLDEGRPSATGLASERVDDGEVNKVACLENTETSAIGRALANLGLAASLHRPSREEMARVDRDHARRVAEASPRRLTSRLQRRADRVMDALELLAEAHRGGLPPNRMRRLRGVLTDPNTTPAIVERVERVLRSWIASRHARRLTL